MAGVLPKVRGKFYSASSRVLLTTMTTLPENIDWRSSIAREILLSDLEDGILSTDEKDLSAEEAWEKCYRHFYEFRKVPFEQFKAKLKDHRNQVQRMINASAEEELALAHDRALHPQKTHNHRGEPVFDVSRAKLLLREDVKNKLHTVMTPSELRESRNEYKLFKLEKFKERIFQAIRLQKYLFYLEMKRAQARKKRGLPPLECL
jgi:hypothetical protein